MMHTILSNTGPMVALMMVPIPKGIMVQGQNHCEQRVKSSSKSGTSLQVQVMRKRGSPNIRSITRRSLTVSKTNQECRSQPNARKAKPVFEEGSIGTTAATAGAAAGGAATAATGG